MGPVSTGIGDHIWIELQIWENLIWSNQSLWSTQPVHPGVGKCNEYQPVGGNAKYCL